MLLPLRGQCLGYFPKYRGQLYIAHAMVKALMEWETIDREQIRDIMEGREPQPPKVYVAENPVMDVTPTDGPSTPPPLPSAT